MKKLFIATAAAMASAAALAIESANTVGYISYEFDEGNEVYEQNIGLCLNDMAASGDLVITDSICGRAVEDGDKVTIYNIDYDTNDEYEYQEGVGWFKTEITFDSVEYDTLASFTIPAGSTFNFIPANASGSINQTGEVAASGTQSLTFQADFDNEIYSFPLVNPYPLATTLANLATFANVDGDKIQIYNTDYGTYDSYEYQEGTGWFKTVITFDGVDYSTIEESDWATTTVLAIGQGAIFTPVDDTERVWSVTYNY